MTSPTTTHKPKARLILGAASVFAATAVPAAATDARAAAKVVAVKIESGRFASSPTRLDRGRTTFLVRKAARARSSRISTWGGTATLR
jgi:thiazole synthase ThiGH ThiG subunit